jgi:hypothetical protein
VTMPAAMLAPLDALCIFRHRLPWLAKASLPSGAGVAVPSDVQCIVGATCLLSSVG